MWLNSFEKHDPKNGTIPGFPKLRRSTLKEKIIMTPLLRFKMGPMASFSCG
jgi:hypothetical protein